MRETPVPLNDIVDALDEFFECAGFSNVYENVLKKMSEDELVELYNTTFSACYGDFND